VVRVTVDAPGGVDLDRITELSRGLSRILDDEDAVDGAYTLEVSSPGLERALRRPAHYRKAIGSEVAVKTGSPVSGATHHRGTLQSADDDAIVVSVDGEERRIGLDDVSRARTVFSWERGPKPGHKRGTS
jgi:ribosome maturation factor RimP